jgi:ribonuclease HI
MPPSLSPAEELKHVLVYTDGACQGNPGPGGWAAVMVYGDKRREMSGGFRRTTNNRMELMGAIEALKAMRYPCAVTLTTDSEYLKKSIELGWARKWKSNNWMRQGERVPNSDLWIELLGLLDVHKVTIVWVRGHTGHPENERCDKLAVVASRAPELPEDAGYHPAAKAKR